MCTRGLIWHRRSLMRPLDVTRYIQQADVTITAMDKIVWDVDDHIHPVFSKHIVLVGSGLIEKAVLFILGEYCKSRSNRKIQKFVLKSVKWENALNCNKIEKLLDRFDEKWWKKVESETASDVRQSIDSLIDVRNQIAHGSHNGTSYSVALKYYEHAKIFVDIINKVVNESDSKHG